MSLSREAVGLREQRRHALEPLVAELGHAAADRAEEMLVVRRVARRLVALEPLAEVALHREPAAHEQDRKSTRLNSSHTS